MTRNYSTIGERTCPVCGNVFTVTTHHPRTVHCSQRCATLSVKQVKCDPPNPSGLCMCGCGGTTPLARKSSQKDGLIAGEHVRYLSNHHKRLTTPAFEIVDAGYETPCHLWQRSIGKSHGYGTLGVDGRSKLAHVVAWEKVNGPVPEGLQLDHLCRNRACVNVAHLEPVTAAENQRRGLNAKLTAADVREIRQRVKTTRTAEIAAQFGVSQILIQKIMKGDAWKNV